jgi:delta24(24(1))-sterol reductase
MSSATPAPEGTKTARQRKAPLVIVNEEEQDSSVQVNGHSNGHANGHANGDAANGNAKDGRPKVIDGWIEGKDPKVDYSGHFEFGGSFGTLALMFGFPLLMWYMWIGATYYDGALPLPKNQTIPEFIAHLGHLVLEGAWPSLKAWVMYWVFFIFEGICYIVLPGITLTGRPLPHEGGKQLPYYCSAVSSFYFTLAVALGLHFSGLFKLYTIIDEFGPLLSVAICSGFLVSFIAYFSAWYRGAQHRMTGYPIYDFFMGAELNPRMFGILDFKMFFEVRLPWYILLLLSMGTAARQYELYGYVSGEVCFLLMAHFLYANACSKGEECIISTWLVYISIFPKAHLLTSIQGYVLRKMGLHAHLLEPCWCSSQLLPLHNLSR